jgi:hypothetical protein
VRIAFPATSGAGSRLAQYATAWRPGT